MRDDFDILLVGGGLQSALIALAVLARRPGARVAIVESAERLGGNHTWCFHASDVPPGARGWVEPLLVQRWPRWKVRFPNLSRTFDSEYAAISSAQLDRVVTEQLSARRGSALFLGETAARLEEREVALASGRTLRAQLVVDARGPLPPSAPARPCGYQKFVGLELEVDDIEKVSTPIIMDARVPQLDGFRFVYALPFAASAAQPSWGVPASPARVLVEETHFSDSPLLDEAALAERALESAARLGLSVRAVLRRERGVLPIPLAWPHQPMQDGAGAARGPLVAGYRGGFFHPTTGYSFPLAVRIAEHLAQTPPAEARGPAWRSLVSQHSRQARFAVLLNRMLFSVSPPELRRGLLERFHRLPAETIARFYALESSGLDRLRILCGPPPRGISLRRALREAVP